MPFRLLQDKGCLSFLKAKPLAQWALSRQSPYNSPTALTFLTIMPPGPSHRKARLACSTLEVSCEFRATLNPKLTLKLGTVLLYFFFLSVCNPRTLFLSLNFIDDSIHSLANSWIFLVFDRILCELVDPGGGSGFRLKSWHLDCDVLISTHVKCGTVGMDTHISNPRSRCGNGKIPGTPWPTVQHKGQN